MTEDRHARFANVCAGIQSLVTAAGIVVAGWWTYTVYTNTYEATRAIAELHRSQIELETRRSELEAAQLKRVEDLDAFHNAFGQVALSTSSVALDRDGHCYVQVIAKVSNNGNRLIRLSFEKNPLHVASVRINGRHVTEFERVVSSPVHTFTDEGISVLTLPRSDLLPGESTEYPFLLRVAKKRMYLIQFSIPVDTARAIGAMPESGGYWAARAYVAACQAMPGREPEESPPSPRESVSTTASLPRPD